MELSDRLLFIINHEAGYERYIFEKETEYSIHFSIVNEKSRRYKIFKSDVGFADIFCAMDDKIKYINEKIKPESPQPDFNYVPGDPFW